MSRGEWVGTGELISKAAGILEMENPMTIRQLFYRLVSVGALLNASSAYKKVSRLMTKARLDNRVPFDWIVDRSRPEYSSSVWLDPASYAETVSRSYRKDYWELQPCYVEVWCEKDAIVGSIEPITHEYGLKIVVGRGFQSTTRINELAERLLEKGRRKEVHIFYLGDHDPSGVDIQADISRRIQSSGCGLRYTMTRLAIHPEDISLFRLPALRVKDTDSRTPAFVEEHGEDCVELDALPPTELRLRIERAVREILDIEKWNRAVAVEQVELASIKSFVTNLQNLKPGQESL